jgi:hypothetical protein
MQLLHRRRLEFLGEQDGPAEQAWKGEVVSLLAENRPLRRAYLARVQYPPETAVSVALCLTGSEDSALVAQIGGLFGARFGRDQHLDILFLDADQESRLAQVCRAFHPAPG